MRNLNDATKVHRAFWFRVLLVLSMALGPLPAYAQEGSWLSRVFSLGSNSANNLGTPSGFMLKDVTLESTCPLERAPLQPVLSKYIGQPVTDERIVSLMRDIRKNLSRRGFSAIKTVYPASETKGGVVKIRVQSVPPKATEGDEANPCKTITKQAQSASGRAHIVRDARLRGITAFDGTPFQERAKAMEGGLFSGNEVVRLMQDIRKAYRDKGLPLPYVAFDKAKTKEGILALRVNEITRPRASVAEPAPENIPTRVARPVKIPTSEADLKRFSAGDLELLDTPEMREAWQQAKARIAAQKEVKKKPAPAPEAKSQTALAKKAAETLPPPALQKKAPVPAQAAEPAQKARTPTQVDEADVIFIDEQQITFLDADTPKNMKFTERPESQLLILEVFVDSTRREDTLIGYNTEKTKKLLLSLSGVVGALGLPIDVNPAQGLATGWIGAPENELRLVYPFKQGRLGDKIFKLKPDDAELHFDDIYVAASVLEMLFDLDIDLNFSAMQLFITPDSPLPFQQQSQRHKRWKNLQQSRKKPNALEAIKKDVPYGLIAKPTIRIDHGSSLRSTNNENLTNHNTSIVTQGDLAGFSAQSTTTLRKQDSENLEVDSFELLLRRHDETNSMLGPLKASSIQLGDINLTAVPLINGNRRGRGVEVTNEPVGFVRDPDNFTLEGFTPPGWDVEIFQDERLLDFQTVDNTGRYEFAAIPLRSGLNVFRIVAYGPNGERREEARRFFLGPGMIKEGEFIYQLSALESTQPLLGFGNNADQSNLGSALQGSFSYGVNRNLSLTGALFDGAINTLDTQAASGGVRASFFETYLQLDAMAEKEGGNIYSATARRNITDTLQLFLGGSTSSGFAPEIRSEKSEWFARLDNSIQLGNLHSIGFTFGINQETFNNGQANLRTFQNRINTFISRFNISNGLELEQRDGQSDRLIGDFDIRRNISGGFVRGSLNYTRENSNFELESARLRSQITFGKNITYIGELNKSFSGDKDLRLTNRLSWQWGGFRLGIQNELVDDGDYQIGLNIGTTLTPDQSGFDLQSSPSAASEGTVLVRVFIDENEDNIYQHGEALLEDVSVTNQRRGNKTTTDKDGLAALHQMAVFQPNHVALDATTLPDFYLQPADKLVSVIARPGIIGTVDMPVYRLGEVAGTVILNQNGESAILEGAPITLTNAEGKRVGRTKSEYDGFFVFPSLRMGTYTLTIPEGYLAQYGLEEPLKTVVSLEGGQSIVDGITLEVTAETKTN